jgi:hypothetical protein
MSGIFGLSKNATTPTVYNSIQLQSSSQAIAVPVYYGTNRGAPNLLWYGGFRKTQVQSSGKGGIGSVSAGKGGGSGQFNYFADVILGVSEGPVQGFGQAWASKTPTTLASLGMTSFLGTYPQTAWSYVTGAYPTEARPYTGLAYLAASGYQLGSAAELPAHTFEVYGFFSQRTVYETGTIPGSGARTITVARRAWANGSTVSLWVSDGNSVVDSNGNVFAKVVGAPGAGQYSVLLGVYTFNAADAGKSVTIAYTGKGQDADPSLIVPDILSNANYGCGFPSAHVGELTAYSEDFVIPGGLSVAVAHAAGFDDNLSVYQAAADQLFTCVASGPGPLQYSYLAGVYTFNAADIGKTVSIAYAALGGLTTYQQYCWANGFFISPVYRSLTTGAAALDEIAKLTNSEVVFSAGALKLVPRGDQTITANGYTYTAPSATVADFTDDQFLNGNQGGGASGQAANDPGHPHPQAPVRSAQRRLDRVPGPRQSVQFGGSRGDRPGAGRPLRAAQHRRPAGAYLLRSDDCQAELPAAAAARGNPQSVRLHARCTLGVAGPDGRDLGHRHAARPQHQRLAPDRLDRRAGQRRPRRHRRGIPDRHFQRAGLHLRDWHRLRRQLSGRSRLGEYADRVRTDGAARHQYRP